MPTRRHAGATLVRIGGAAGVAGGLCWVVKSGSILATGVQPALTLELALPLLGASLVGVAGLVLPPGRRRRVVATAAWLAVGSGLIALGSELLGESWDPFIAAWGLALLTGQQPARRAPLPWSPHVLDRGGHGAGAPRRGRARRGRRAPPRGTAAVPRPGLDVDRHPYAATIYGHAHPSRVSLRLSSPPRIAE